MVEAPLKLFFQESLTSRIMLNQNLSKITHSLSRSRSFVLYIYMFVCVCVCVCV